MPKVKVKEIRERANRINQAWEEGAPAVVFNGIKQADYNTKIQNAAATDLEIADLYRQIEMKEAVRDTQYADIDNYNVKIANGVRGDKDYGDDSPLYGAMGFVRKSERKSGLSRKKKTP
jgi:hypothetical protein